MLGRRLMVAFVAFAVLTTVTTACQPGRVGARCRTTDFGDDGGAWVLQCRNGRWVRLATKQQVAAGVLAATASAGSSSGSVGPTLSNATPAANDDYPAAWRDAPQDSLFDPWGYPNRQCTSFVAWRLSNANRATLPVRPGDAGTWDDVLAPYVRIDATPAVGAIAHWNPGEAFGGLVAGPIGHIGWVQAVHPDGSVTVEQYNLGADGRYVQFRTRAPRYLHVKDL